MTPNTYALDDDAPNAADYDSVYPYYLRNYKNNKNNMTPNTYSPNNDAPDAADYDADSSNSIILDSSLKCKIDPKSMLKLK